MAISEKMHVSKQTRQLGQAATDRVTLVQGNPRNREAFLSIRLWNTGDNGETVPLYWDSGAPAVCLTADLIAASGGEPVSSNGGVLVTSFHSDHVAISSARRLQWAVQGFTESRNSQGISVVVLVHSAEELSTGPVGDALRNALDQAPGGQILLTEKASQFFEDLPGFASQTLDGTGLRELQWRSPESHATRSFDEQWLMNYIQQQGLEEQISGAPVQAEAPDTLWKADSSDEDERAAASGLSSPKVRWAIGGLLAAALVGGIFFFMNGKSAPPASTPAVGVDRNPLDSTTTQSPQTSSSVTTTAPTQTRPTENQPTREKPGRNDKKDKKEKQQEAVAATPQQEPPPRPAPVVVAPPPPTPVDDRSKKNSSKGCDLDSGQIKSYLGRAEKALGSGNYSTARRLYSEVLPCPDGASSARAGLERVRDASGESEPQN